MWRFVSGPVRSQHVQLFRHSPISVHPSPPTCSEMFGHLAGKRWLKIGCMSKMFQRSRVSLLCHFVSTVGYKQFNALPHRRVWQDPGWHTVKVKAYRAARALSTNGKHGHNRIIHGFLLMSWKEPSSVPPLSLLKLQSKIIKCIVHQSFIVPLVH